MNVSVIVRVSKESYCEELFYLDKNNKVERSNSNWTFAIPNISGPLLLIIIWLIIKVNILEKKGKERRENRREEKEQKEEEIRSKKEE